MQAHQGDRLIIHSMHLGGPQRDAEILEVHGDNGEPPYLVRWGDTGHEALVFPGPDASIEAYAHDEPKPGGAD